MEDVERNEEWTRDFEREKLFLFENFLNFELQISTVQLPGLIGESNVEK